MSSSVRLSDSFTTFLFDFKLLRHYSEYSIGKSDGNSLWKRSAVTPDANYLFNHVQDFFIKNSGNTEVDGNQCIIYELKNDKLSPEEKQKLLLFSSFFTRNHFLKNENGEPIHFKIFNDSSVLSPKIFICPLTSIGILTLSFQLKNESSSLDNLTSFNYSSRIFSAGNAAVFHTAKNIHPAAAEQENKIQTSLNTFIKKKEAKNETVQTNEENYQWSLKNLIQYLMQDFDEGSVEEVSPARMQAFTYAQTETKLNEQELAPALFRLRRMYSTKQIPSEAFLKNSEEVTNTFEEVHMGASVEGAVILVNADKNSLSPFLLNFGELIKSRNIWTYFLAYHQRIALIVAAHEIADLYHENETPNIKMLSGAVKKLTTIQLKCMFSEISHFTQQNDFYYLCCRTLRLPQLFEELKEELHELSNILSDEWHKKELREREIHEKAEKEREKKFAILIGILVIPQVWYAAIGSTLEPVQTFIKSNSGFFNFATLIMWIGIIGVACYGFLYKKN